MDKNTVDQKLKMNESLKKYLVKNGYTKTLAVLEQEKVFKTPPRRSARLSFAILKAPKRVALPEIPEKSKKKSKKTNLETEKGDFLLINIHYHNSIKLKYQMNLNNSH